MKKIMIFFIFLMIASFMGCGSSSHGDSYTILEEHANGKLYWIYLTNESAQKREELREKHGNLILTKEYYPSFLASLKNRTREQVFPTVSVKNHLDSISYGSEKVYTLDKGSYDNIVLYIHGGAYVLTIDEMHVSFCDKLVDELNAKVYMPIYPLAPQATYKEAYNLLDSLYPELLNQNKPIYIIGDSAGGGLSLAYTEYLKNKGERLPNKMVLISPFLDATLSNPDIPAYEEIDLTLATYAPRELVKYWAGNLDVRNFLISPINGDLTGLPPTLLFVGTDEIIYPDTTLLYNKMKDLGEEVSLAYGEELWHTFPVDKIPEQKTSIRLIKDFVK